MPKLHVAPDLALPLEIVTSTNALLAKRGSGKTYTAAVMAEEMLKAKLPIAVVDPTGAWWGLRSSADGRGEGFPVVVFGGDHADVALDEKSGEDIARFIVNDRPPGVIIDRSHMRKAEGVRFMLPFIETLYRLNRDPLHLFWDECDTDIPQKPMSEQARLLGAAEDLVRRGRIKGLGVSLISQRPAVVNKDVLTQTETLIVMRMVGPQDIDAVRAWVKQHDIEDVAPEMLASLPSLPVGDSWWWSPGFLEIFKHTRVRERETFDSSRTPKVGERVRPPKVLAPVDLERLRERFAASIEKAKADDPKALRAEIQALRKQVATSTATRPSIHHPASQIADAKREGRSTFARELAPLVKSIEQTYLKLRRTPIAELDPALGAANDAIQALHDKVHEKSTFKKADYTLIAKPEGAITAGGPRTQVTRVDRERPIRKVSDNGDLSQGKQAILNAIVELHALGIEYPRVEQIALLRGVSHTTGTFKQDMRELLAAAHIDKADPGVYVISPSGEKLADASNAPTTIAELHRRWLSTVEKMSKSRADILRFLISVHDGQPVNVEQIAQQLGKSHTTGTFKQDIRTLANLQLIRRDRGDVTPTDVLFPHGR